MVKPLADNLVSEWAIQLAGVGGGGGGPEGRASKAQLLWGKGESQVRHLLKQPLSSNQIFFRGLSLERLVSDLAV